MPTKDELEQEVEKLEKKAERLKKKADKGLDLPKDVHERVVVLRAALKDLYTDAYTQDVKGVAENVRNAIREIDLQR